MIVEQWRKNEDKIRKAGHIAVLEARQAGAPAYYHDSIAGGLIREMPDGSRQLVTIVDGRDYVEREVEPR